MTKEDKAHDLYCGSAVDDLGLSPPAFRVLFHIRRRRDKNGIAKCGIRSMAKVCKMRLSTVIEAIRELENHSLIGCQRKLKSTSQYRILPYQEWIPICFTIDNSLDNSSVIPNDTDTNPSVDNLFTKVFTVYGQSVIPNESICYPKGPKSVPTGGTKGTPLKVTPKKVTPKKVRGVAATPAPEPFFASQESEKNGDRQNEDTARASPPLPNPIEPLVAGVARTLGAKKPISPPETKDECIQRLVTDFPSVDVQDAATNYQHDLDQKQKIWKNGRFVALVTDLYRRRQQGQTS